jgi:hypothetical protein
VDVWKTRFHQNRQQWVTKKAAFPYITDEFQRAAEADTIKRLRIAMNQDGSRVLMQYSLDTTGIEVDSLTHWLALIETYPADLRLARHHFFSGAYTAFDNLWGQIPSKYDLGEGAEDEFERLGAVYDTLRTQLQTGGRLDQLPAPMIEALRTWASDCDEPGFLSEVILWRNGIEQSPDCSGGGSRPTSSITTPPDAKQGVVKVYPNPVKNTLNIEYPLLSVPGRLRLYNLQGQIVSDVEVPAQSSGASLQTNHIVQGVYFVELHYGQGLVARTKVVVSN